MILVEGESEKNIAQVLKRFSPEIKNSFSGKTITICLTNISPRKLKNSLNMSIKKKEDIFIIVDTDVFNNQVIFKNFLNNLNIIINHKKVRNVELILQFNLENELSKALSINTKQLFDSFKVIGKEQFINKLNKMDQRALYKKIEPAIIGGFWQNKFLVINKRQKHLIDDMIQFKNHTIVK